jgi:hypothetical protein
VYIGCGCLPWKIKDIRYRSNNIIAHRLFNTIWMRIFNYSCSVAFTPRGDSTRLFNQRLWDIEGMSECDGGTGVSEYMCCAGRIRPTDFAKHVAWIKNYLLGCFGKWDGGVSGNEYGGLSGFWAVFMHAEGGSGKLCLFPWDGGHVCGWDWRVYGNSKMYVKDGGIALFELYMDARNGDCGEMYLKSGLCYARVR